MATVNLLDLGNMVRKMFWMDVEIVNPYHKREFTYKQFLRGCTEVGFYVLRVRGQDLSFGRLRIPKLLALGLSRTVGKYLPFITRQVIVTCTKA